MPEKKQAWHRPKQMPKNTFWAHILTCSKKNKIPDIHEQLNISRSVYIFQCIWLVSTNKYHESQHPTPMRCIERKNVERSTISLSITQEFPRKSP
jgi:hypothetical protein